MCKQCLTLSEEKMFNYISSLIVKEKYTDSNFNNTKKT